MRGPGEKSGRDLIRGASLRAMRPGDDYTTQLCNSLALRRREAAIEGLALLRHVEKKLRRLEPLAADFGEGVAKIDESLGAHTIDIGDGSAGERGEAEPENR